MEEFKIFVAGIPYNTSEKDVINFFGKFGKVLGVAKHRRSTKHHNSYQQCYIREGHCVLALSDYETFDSILKTKNITMFGRSIMCEAYKSGVQLYKQNSVNNKKRVILKNVPTQYEDEEVKTLLQSAYGEVDTLYHFISEQKSPGKFHKKRKYKSFSVMFKHEASAQKAAEDKFLNFDNSCIVVIEKYKIQRKGKRVENEQKKSSTQRTLPTRASKHKITLVDFEMDPEREDKREITSQIRGEIFRPGNKSSTSLSAKSTTDSEAIMRSTVTSVSIGKIKKMQETRHHFLEFLIDQCSKVKPTSKTFSRLRAYETEYLVSFELRNAWFSKTNVQFKKRVNQSPPNVR